MREPIHHAVVSIRYFVREISRLPGSSLVQPRAQTSLEVLQSLLLSVRMTVRLERRMTMTILWPTSILVEEVSQASWLPSIHESSQMPPLSMEPPQIVSSLPMTTKTPSRWPSPLHPKRLLQHHHHCLIRPPISETVLTHRRPPTRPTNVSATRRHHLRSLFNRPLLHLP